MSETPTVTKPVPEEPKRGPRKWVRYGAYGVGGIVLGCIGLAAVAGTGPMLRMATPFINQTVSAATDSKFELGEITGSLWTGLTLDHLSMDRAGDDLFLELNQLEFDWSPLALLRGHVQVDRISLASSSIFLPDGSDATSPEDDADDGEGGFVLPVSVAIDALELPEVAVVDQITGKSFLYGLSGRAAIGKNLSGNVFVDLQPRDGSSDQLKVDLAFDGPAQELSAEIDGAIGRDGIVMTLAGVAPADATDIHIALSGAGPADNWQGKLDLSAAGYAALSSDIGITLASDTVGFDLDGGLELLDQISAQLPDGLSNKIDLGIGGEFDQGNQSLAFNRLSVAVADALAINGTTQLDLEQSDIVADLTVALDPALSAFLDDAVRWDSLGLSLQVDGDLAHPGLTLTVDGQNLTTPVSRISDVNLAANMNAPDGPDVPFEPQISLKTTGTNWNDPALGALLGEDQKLSVASVIAPDFKNFSVRELALDVPGIVLRGEADIDDALVFENARLVGDIADLSILAPLSGMALGGAGQIVLDDLSGSVEDGINSDIRISAREIGFGIADLDRIVGPAPVIDGTIALQPNLDLAIDLKSINTEMIDGPARIDLRDSFAKLGVEAELDLAPGVVPPGIGVAIKPAKLSVALDGDIAAPAGQIALSVPSVEAGGQAFETVSITTQMAWSEQSTLSLINKGSFGLSGKRYDLSADVLLPSEALRIEGISLKGRELTLTGDMSLPDYATSITGDFTLSNLDAELLADFGVPLTNGAITANIEMRPDGARQTVMLGAMARGLRLASEDDADPFLIEDIKLNATVGNAFEVPEIAATLEGRDIGGGRLSVDQIIAEISGGLDALDIAVDSEGMVQGQVPITTEIAARVALGADVELQASKLDLSVGDQVIALKRPLVFTQTENGLQQLDAWLDIGAGALIATLDQEVGQKSVKGDVALENIELGPWGQMFGYNGMTGVANLTASLRETRGALPTAKVQGGISGITSKVVQDMRPFEIALNFALDQGRLDGQVLIGNGESRLLSADGVVPLAISVLEQNFSPDMSAPLSAKVRVDGEIAEFWPYVPAPDHMVSGDLNLAVDVTGTLDDVRWTGNVALASGQYENLIYGTILDQMTLTGAFDQNGLSIPSFSATDVGNGTVGASFDLRMLDGGEIAYEASAELRDVAVSRKDELQFWADVDASVTGNQQSADIKSTVKMNRGEVDLTLALPESVPTIEVSNLPDADDVEAEETDEEAPGFTGNLDVVVDIPGRLFVRGKGLDSEWGGRLEITGTTNEPVISGQLEALYGQLSVIGKTFVIKDSNIVFSGAVPPDPMLDIAGVYTTSDLEVTAGFQGHASDPELVLSSNPSLPEDEILSQVLFGKSQGSLSAVEAVQLASALNELSGGGTGLDVVGSVRRFIGADVLQVGGGEDGPEVKVGKYLAEGVYVGTKAGASPGSSGVEVEIEVTPSISVTSETTEIDSKAGVQYRLDY
jgi:translocation and assembly module TamB